MNAAYAASSQELFRKHLLKVQSDTDQLFFWLLLGQWLSAVAIALAVSPYAWHGQSRSLHLHVQMAVLLGGALNALPMALIRRQPGSVLTQRTVAVVQMLWSALLIDLTGGRIETHFHVFGSLAFLAFYRDSKILLLASGVVTVDHLARGLLWPEAVYGTNNPEWWRSFEHAGWVLFEALVLIVGTERARREMMLLAERKAALEQTHALVEEQVQARTRELGDSLERYRALVENTNAIPWELDAESGKLLYIAPQAARFFGCTIEELLLRFHELVHPDDLPRVMAHLTDAVTGQTHEHDSLDYRMSTGDGRLLHVRTNLSERKPGEPLRGITIDISKQARLESDLRQAQKLESIGKLAAGVAHEINTPVQFVSDSVHFVKSASDDLLALIARYRAAPHGRGAGEAEAQDEAERFASDIDLDYLSRQVPRALELALEGLGRVTTIVRSMRELAYPQAAEMVSADLNQAIQSTLTIARSEYKYVAELETDYGPLPPVRCHVGDINQVVINIVVNAAHAIAAKGEAHKGTITVRTRQEAEHVIISILDTGGGIPAHLHERIFDPFFTTKAVGRGTGQGLAIAHTIVVERHRGALWFESRVGVGTTFHIRIPIAGTTQAERPAA